MVVFVQKWLYSGKSVSIAVKLSQFFKSGCIREKVVLFGQKWLYSGKELVFVQKWLYSGKVVVFGQK